MMLGCNGNCSCSHSCNYTHLYKGHVEPSQLSLSYDGVVHAPAEGAVDASTAFEDLRRPKLLKGSPNISKVLERIRTFEGPQGHFHCLAVRLILTRLNLLVAYAPHVLETRTQRMTTGTRVGVHTEGGL